MSASTTTINRVGRLDGFAFASIVCAVVGLFALPVVGPVLGIVFGKRALRNIEADPALEGNGLARAGIIVGWAGLVVSLILAAVLLTAFGWLAVSEVQTSVGQPVLTGG